MSSPITRTQKSALYKLDRQGASALPVVTGDALVRRGLALQRPNGLYEAL